MISLFVSRPVCNLATLVCTCFLSCSSSESFASNSYIFFFLQGPALWKVCYTPIQKDPIFQVGCKHVFDCVAILFLGKPVTLRQMSSPFLHALSYFTCIPIVFLKDYIYFLQLSTEISILDCALILHSLNSPFPVYLHPVLSWIQLFL